MEVAKNVRYIPNKGFPVNHNAICHSDTLEMFVNTIDNGGTDNPKMSRKKIFVPCVARAILRNHDNKVRGGGGIHWWVIFLRKT